jgi:hypothetical protein
MEREKSMIKMFYALLAIALMFAANFLITFARSLEKGWWRRVLTVVAFTLWIPIIIFVLGALL